MAKHEPHESHDMGEWESATVVITDTARFGEVRVCRKCGAEQARTASGHAMQDELALRCPRNIPQAIERGPLREAMELARQCALLTSHYGWDASKTMEKRDELEALLVANFK